MSDKIKYIYFSNKKRNIIGVITTINFLIKLKIFGII